MIAPYVDIFRAKGARGFAVAGFVARLPISMLGVGIVLLVSGGTGRFGVAGAVAGTFSFVQAVLAPLLGRLVDRLGQARVAVPGAIVSSGGLIALVVLVLRDAPPETYFVAAAIGGVAMPNIGSLVRARWSSLYTGTPHLHTSYSFESIVDEMIFIVGPPLVTVLTVQVARWSGLATAISCLLVGTLALASQRSTEPAPAPAAGHRAGHSAFGIPGVRVLMAAFIGLGGMFGTVEVTTVAFANEQGRPALAGLLLGLYALGSLLAGLVFGARRPRSPLHRRLVVGLAACALTAVPLTLITDLRLFAAAMVLAGVAISPTLITGFGLAEDLVPADRLTEGLAVEMTGLALGVTLGSALAGLLIDGYGAHRAYLLAVAAGLAATAVAVAGNAQLDRPGVRGRG
jgi:MFS family permease